MTDISRATLLSVANELKLEQHLDQWRATHAALEKRLTGAEEGLKRAEAAARTADDAAERCYRTGDGDPMKAEAAKAEAHRVLGVARRVRDYASEAVTNSHAVAAKEAQAACWAPVYDEGIRRRIEAAAKAEKARALLAEAEAEHRAGTFLLTHAYGNGCPHRADSVIWDRPPTTEAAERAIWEVA